MISHASASICPYQPPQGADGHRPRPRSQRERGAAALQFTPKAGAPVVMKLLESAVANARQQSPGTDVDALFVSKATVDKAPNKHNRRWRPRAMGRATQITKGITHIVIELDER